MVCDGDVELRKKLTGDLRRDFLNLSVKYRKLAMKHMSVVQIKRNMN